MGKLTVLGIAKFKKKGLYGDGDNLYLQVGDTGNKSWIFRYMVGGKAQKIGLGSLKALSLSDARDMAGDYRKQINLGINPAASRKAQKANARVQETKGISFEDCAKAYIASHKDGWKNAKHIQQWENTLAAYAYPIIGRVPVSDIDISLVLRVLEQKNEAFPKGETLWKARQETANRLRGRIESILDWAAVREYRGNDNPARWRGKLEKLLANYSRARSIEHHAALPYAEMNGFLASLAEQEGSAVYALKLVIYTATRTSETIGAKWDEVDIQNKLWVIPSDRMKSGREHRIPLSKPAVAILEKLKAEKKGDSIFPGRNNKQAMSNMALLALLRRMNRTDITVHGFRSTFRDWAAEQTNYPREIAEAALAHIVRNQTEAAYQRGDFLEKRRQMMEDWGRYCQKKRDVSD